ncbi:zinc finger BED domain-containing protein DAYSLEEPER-like protein [Tanacetum coccineum]
MYLGAGDKVTDGGKDGESVGCCGEEGACGVEEGIVGIIERDVESFSFSILSKSVSLSNKSEYVMGDSPTLMAANKRGCDGTWSISTQEALQVCQEMAKKVRDCVKYVKASEALEEYFPDLKQLQVLNTRNLSLDDQTKWNTTYEMLLAASELKEEFSRLDTLYPDYFKSPSGEDWKFVDNLCTYLKLIFDTANLLTSSSVPTANNFFHEAWKLQLELTRASTSEDKIVTTITKPMIAGFDKYWKSSCLVLAIAVVMDPRFKMKLVEFSFAKIFGDEAASYINIVDEGIHQLFLDYAAGDVTRYLSNGDGHGLGHTYFDDFIMESASQQLKSELDQYLEESLNVESK